MSSTVLLTDHPWPDVAIEQAIVEAAGFQLVAGPIDAPAPEVIETIESVLTVDGGGSLRRVRAVKSGSHANAYFISGDIDGPGLQDDGPYGTWFSNSVDEVRMILAVPAVATQFSDVGDASSTDAQATMSDPGARESVECARRA